MIDNTDTKIIYEITSSVNFYPITFEYMDNQYLDVYADDTLLTLDLDFQVVADTIYLLIDKTKYSKLTISRNTEITQEANISTYSKIDPTVITGMVDKLTMICQELKEQLSRCISVDITDDTDSTDDILDTILDALARCESAEAQINSLCEEFFSSSSSSSSTEILTTVLATEQNIIDLQEQVQEIVDSFNDSTFGTPVLNVRIPNDMDGDTLNCYIEVSESIDFTSVKYFSSSSNANLMKIAIDDTIIDMPDDGIPSYAYRGMLMVDLSELDKSKTYYARAQFKDDIYTSIWNTTCFSGYGVIESSISSTSSSSSSSTSSASLPIGTIIQSMLNSPPTGFLSCNGHQYSRYDYSELWANYIEAGLVPICTETTWWAEYELYGGQCGKFGVDTATGMFRVPCFKDGAIIAQAHNDSEHGVSYNQSLPNITGEFGGTELENQLDSLTGAFYHPGGVHHGASRGSDDTLVGFDASRCSPAYQDNADVKMNQTRLHYYIAVS